ncbi:RING-type domain-containing protein [Citrus sinensis]|nr:RING-type domain-containing protein [Citrus sinensis]
MSTNKIFRNKNLCRHPFCQECIAKYIESKVQDSNTAKIECPGLRCEQFLDPFSCKSMIPPSLFSKWYGILCEDYVLGFERSYCPNRNCMGLVVNECERKGTLKKARCPNCKRWFCFRCKSNWHAGYRCEEIGDLLGDRNDMLFGRLVKSKNWVRCPGCGHCVERRDGCPVMKCRLFSSLFLFSFLFSYLYMYIGACYLTIIVRYCSFTKWVVKSRTDYYFSEKIIL